MGAARQPWQVAAAVGVMRQVDEPACYRQRPPPHLLAAVGAPVTGPVQQQPPFTFLAVRMTVATLPG
jgi:hypothetical protein